MGNNKMTLGERIKSLRKEKNLTQLELAQLLNVTDKAVSKWESTEGNPDISLLSKLSEIFDVSIDYILTGKIPEDKIVLMSKAELCAKNDDINLLEELIQNPPKPDDKGLTLFDYIFQYSSKKVFKKLSDANQLSLFINKDVTRQSVLNRSYNANRISLVTDKLMVKNQKLSDLVEMYILSDSLHNLPQLGLNKLSDANFYEWDEKLINIALRSDIPENSRKIIFSAHENENGNWPAIYSKFIEVALINENKEATEFLFNLITIINQNALET
jgi:transcriptional regulator with XRE-family HTH domain